MKISTNYEGNMRFANRERGAVMMDAAKEGGGAGEAPTPKQLVLHGLAGCTGMDVATILSKKKVPFDNFSIEVEADQTEYHPKVFKNIQITYRFSADPAHRPAIERAVTLSRENFCGVSAMLEKTATITHEIVIEPRAE